MSASHAWEFFLENHQIIRACIETFTHDSDQFNMADFDAAVNQADRDTLTKFMREAWRRAPDGPEVYEVPGFRELSDLLDGSVPGFTTESESSK